jgi:hypothetical protein
MFGENRNDPDLVQAYLKKWWVESDFKAPNLPFSLRLKVSFCIQMKNKIKHTTLLLEHFQSPIEIS